MKPGACSCLRNSGAGQVAVSEENGRAGRNRTRNRRFWRPVLYQLSYCPNPNCPLIKSLCRRVMVSRPGNSSPLWTKTRRSTESHRAIRRGRATRYSTARAGRSPDGLCQLAAYSAAIPETQRVSRCRACLRQNRQYFLNSTRSGCRRRFLVVV